MENKPIFLLAGLLVAVVLVSGCASGGGGGGIAGPGISIVNFAPDLPTATSGNKMKLSATIKNNGVEDATNVKVVVAGIDASEWQTSFDERFVGQLTGFDALTKTEGQSIPIIWTNLIAPKLGEGNTQTYRPQLRVTYDYITTGILPITFVDREELKRLVRESKPLPTGSLTSSAGPLRVEIRTGNFIPTTTTGQGRNKFQVNIKLFNTAGGSVIPGTLTSGQNFDTPIRITIDEPVGTSITSFGFGTGCSDGELVEGIRNVWEISCEMEVTNPPTSRVERTFKVKLEYTYLITTDTQITVTDTGDVF